MPYIKQPQRPALDKHLGPLNAHIVTAGELNYAITRLCLGFVGGQPRYDDFNKVMGVLACAAAELYRRHVAPYEDQKIAENGDVSG